MTETRPKRSIARRAKVKTGCATCKVRKVKCDEAKPFCVKCVSTGRSCDGYEARFRSVVAPPAAKSSSDVLIPIIRPVLSASTPDDLELLNHYFTTKTMCGVKVDCVQEARQILQASSANPPLRFAISALKTLRYDRESRERHLALSTRQPSRYDQGLRQYTTALGQLCSHMSSPGFNNSQSALLCCQIFISIEQVREDYAAMVQHIIQGLLIMRGSQARPTIADGCELITASWEQQPLLDVFLIKLFAAPCRFAEAPDPEAEDASHSGSRGVSHQQPPGQRNLRIITPDTRGKLTKIALSTIGFLDKVAQVRSLAEALGLRKEKSALLSALTAWLAELQDSRKSTSVEPLSMSFTRLLHLILKVVLLGALDDSAMLKNETAEMQELGNMITGRVRHYHAYRSARAPVENDS